MELPQPTHKNYTTLISDIETGQIKIPQFQRDFVWSIERSAALLDSVIKGYPIGTFISWRTKERLRSVKKLGNEILPSPKEDEFVTYVLDGQQRLTSLYAARKGLEIPRSPRKIDNFGNIYVNLNANDSEDIVITDISELDKKTYIRLTDLLADSDRFAAIFESFPSEHKPKILDYLKLFNEYQFSVIEIKEAPIDIATEIFTRINVEGKELTVFEIMVAKTYDEERDFDLSKEYDKLIEKLEQIDYHTISKQTILRLVAQILKKDSKRQTILDIEKEVFIQTWPKVVDSIECAVEHFRNVIRIPVSRLLPYLDLLVPFAYFFYHHSEQPTAKQAKELENFFWRCSLADRYSSSVDSKLTQDIKRVDLILRNKTPDYDWKIDTSAEYLIENGWFSTGTSFIKAILCIMAYQRPLSFNNNGIVRINNDWLKQSNSKNYHHFFPKAFLKKNGVDKIFANNILNITIVDDYLNKREIGAKSPSQYMKKFKTSNPELTETMKTHLIGDLTEFGIWDNDYNTFIHKRAEIISKEIKKRIIVR